MAYDGVIVRCRFILNVFILNAWNHVMKRTWLLCAVSAILGGILAITWERGPSIEKRTMAQEPIPGMVRPGVPMNGPVNGNLPQGFAPSVVAPPAADPRMGQEFTAEERVNIWV